MVSPSSVSSQDGISTDPKQSPKNLEIKSHSENEMFHAYFLKVFQFKNASWTNLPHLMLKSKILHKN